MPPLGKQELPRPRATHAAALQVQPPLTIVRVAHAGPKGRIITAFVRRPRLLLVKPGSPHEAVTSRFRTPSSAQRL